MPAHGSFVCDPSSASVSGRLHWPIALLSILIGTWTHIAWDSFTHQTGWTATRVSALNAPVSLFGWETETAHLLQYVSSVFGLVVLALWFRRLLGRVPARVVEDQSRPRASWVVLATVACVSALIGVSRAYLSWHAGSFYHLGLLVAHPHDQLVRGAVLRGGGGDAAQPPARA